MKTQAKKIGPLKRGGMFPGLLTAAVSLTLVAGPTFAGSKGRKNTVIGLGAATVYELFKGQTKTGIVLGAGTAVAWKQYEIARQREKRAQEAKSNSPVLSSNTVTSARPPVRAGSGGSGSTARPSAISRVSAKPVPEAAFAARVAAVKQDAAIRQAAMQQNLDELALQTRALSAQNQLQNSQLASFAALNAESLKAVTRYSRWAMVAVALAAFALGGLLYTLLRPRSQGEPLKPATTPA